MDGGTKIEYAIRDAIDKQKDFYNFAGAVRALARELGLSNEERDNIFGALADRINSWS